MDFMVVRSTSPHNRIIGRPGLRKIQAAPSTTYGMIKFPVMGGILTLKSSKIIPVECAMVSGLEEQPISVNKVREERVKVEINPEHPEQTVMIGSDLMEKTRGVPRHIAEHRLNLRKGCQPVRKKKRGQAAERNIAINDEVSKLVATGIMREVHYHDWLSNPVMVKKSDNRNTTKLPSITAPEEQEELIVYLAASKEAVSAVLMTEREARQMPIYFVSRALRGPEVNYTPMEKLVLALVHASKRLRRYFQAHPIIVITD
ncbi:reverse transcriptase domain-containing protein [Tanacetum coccineum]|uniref:Reverse transcriptase domain-containing protein n=1 Tax=Tanacetum coccineum TaxID=301880 RepID=A0ABQ5EY54_9ASTR